MPKLSRAKNDAIFAALQLLYAKQKLKVEGLLDEDLADFIKGEFLSDDDDPSVPISDVSNVLASHDAFQLASTRNKLEKTVVVSSFTRGRLPLVLPLVGNVAASSMRQKGRFHLLVRSG